MTSGERPVRARGVLGLDPDACTVCMLCVRECPDWCIEIEGHVETLPADSEHARPRSVNVLDRFVVDFGLCLYCGICVEVCPFDALHWAPQAEYAGRGRSDLRHGAEQLTRWDSDAPPPAALDDRAVPLDPGPRRR